METYEIVALAVGGFALLMAIRARMLAAGLGAQVADLQEEIKKLSKQIKS